MMMHRRKFIKQLPLFGLALGGSSLIGSCRKPLQQQQSATPILKELSFGILTTESVADLEPKWQPFLEDMSAAVGLPIKPFFAMQYSSLIESMRADVIQVAWFGGQTYIEAAKLADAEAFVSTVSDKGEKGYYAHLIAHRDRPWLKEMTENKVQYLLNRDNAQQLTFAFNDLNSTSGYLVPMYYLFTENSIDPLQHFQRVSFLGSHEATVLAIANQEIDIATNNSEALVRFQGKFPELYKNIVVLWRSPLIPSDPIAYDKELPDELKQKIRDFFLNYQDQTVLNELDWSRFDAATDKDWNPIRELKIGKQILEIKQNEAISEAEKKNILEGLKAQLDNLRTEDFIPQK
ncbi:MAG: phosphonate ABC transporter substrate-binding protein [Limnothrix sp.]